MTTAPLFLPMSDADIGEIAVAIGRLGRYLHAGIIYRRESKLYFLDLVLDGQIQSALWATSHAAKFAWVVPPLHPLLLEHLAVLCQKIAASNQRVPYGIKYVPSAFSAASGSVRLGNGMIGFTCTTFVLAVFWSHKHRLVLENTWRDRSGDSEWQAEVVELLKTHSHAYGIPASEISQNESDMGCFRFRPEQVIGACRSRFIPVDFDKANELGDELWGWLDGIKLHRPFR